MSAIPFVMHGAGGRMGRRIIALSQEDAQLQLVGAVEHAGSPHLGKDAGTLAQAESAGVLVQHSFALQPGQVVIDFSLPHAFDAMLETVVASGAALVSGTTGLSEAQSAKIREASAKIAVLHSPNTSVGVNLLFLAAKWMTQWVGEDFDIEVFEAHHRFKRDAPSGTAVRLAEVIAEAREQTLADVAEYDRTQRDEPRRKEEIGIQSMRGGDIVGEHTAFFCAMGERIELTHRATSRDIFARGALRLAKWIHGKPAGLYTMADALSLPA